MINDDTIYRLLKVLVRALGLLPTWFGNFCADFLGLLWFKIDTKHRIVTLLNLTHAYGRDMSETQIEVLAKQVFKNLASILFEVAWIHKFNNEKFFSRYTIKGMEHIDNAHSKGNGVLILLCHIGNFELIIPSAYQSGYDAYVTYRKLDFAPLERLVLEMRQRFGVTMLPLRGAGKKIDHILERGGVVGSLLDQNVDWYKGVFVDYFGRPACTNTGFAKIALRTQAAVVPMSAVRDRKTRKYHIEFFPEIPRVETGDPIKDLEINTQNYSAAIEAMVRRYPDQYFWVHKRWKTRNFCPWPRPEYL